MLTDSTRRSQLISSLRRDRDYRDAFVAQHIATSLPFQIRALREDRGWTQEELGRRADMAQETISLLENPNYGRLTLQTLKRLASAFDIALIVKFIPFSGLVDGLTNLSHRDLLVPSFEEDGGFQCPRKRNRTTPRN